MPLTTEENIMLLAASDYRIFETIVGIGGNNETSLVSNIISRILEYITNVTKELPRADYIELLGELQDEIDSRLDLAKSFQEDEAQKEFEGAIDAEVAQELEHKRELDGSEGE